MEEDEDDPLTRAVIGASIEVHRHLGPGLLESIYLRCLCRELDVRGIPYAKSVRDPVAYKGHALGDGLVMDLVVDGNLDLELKAVEQLAPVHEVQDLSSTERDSSWPPD
jgi:GxxExxY protein